MRGKDPIEKRYIRNNYVYTAENRGDVLADHIPAKRPEEHSKPVFDRVKGLDEITKMQYADIHIWLLYDILQKADKMSMAHSLELRVPFLDREVLGVAMKIPTRFRVDKTDTKLALREYAKERLPEETATMAKLGFPVPLHAWLSEERYYNIVREKFESDTAARFFDRAAIISGVKRPLRMRSALTALARMPSAP
jgi:asparagine synthase (glutamine-hydrolysing)